MSNNFKQDEKELIKFYINNFFPNFFNNPNNNCIITDISVEFILDTVCNQHCDYCYITKYGKQLYSHPSYPINTYLKNISLFLNTLIKQKIIIHTFELFAGDVFKNDLYYQIADLIYNYKEEMDKILKKDENKNFKDLGITIDIICPINISHITEEYHNQKIREYHKKFLKNSIVLALSISHDGYYATEEREKRIITEEEYDIIFKFVIDLNYAFHPMFSPNNIKNGVKNIEWWNTQFKKYHREKKCYPMYLHVRNDGWTNENIQDYLKVMDKCWELRMNYFQQDIKKMAKYLIGLNDYEREYKEGGFDPIQLLFAIQSEGERASCSIHNNFFLDAGDLSIVCCHRMSYKQFQGGQFITHTNQYIDDIEPLNVSFWTSYYNYNPLMNLVCFDCLYKHLCIKGCLGSQYETNGDFLVPIPSVCNLEKARIEHWIELVYTSGILEYMLKEKLLPETVENTIIGIIKQKEEQ